MRADDLLTSLATDVGLTRDDIEPFARAIARLEDDGAAALRLDRVVRAAGATRTRAIVEAGHAASLVELLAASASIADSLTRAPELAGVLAGEPRPRDPDALRRDVELEVDGAPLTRAVARLFAVRDRETIRIAWLDVAFHMEVSAVVHQLSLLADVLIDAALRVARRRLQADGIEEPAAARGFAVIALGKLGGDELNYSSDIDLLFVWDCDDGGRDASTTWYDKLGRRLISLLGPTAERPQLYRVDLRLRPEGHTGPLTRSIASSERYYREFGRPWERQMLLKARPCAGDLTVARRLLDRLRPFIAESTLQAAAIADLKRLRKQMEPTRPRADSATQLDIKTGKGGIRDIEFSIQFLQLLHAAERPDVLCANTIEAITRLTRADAFSNDEAAFLHDAYRFLRRVENHLQLFAEVQTHELPSDDARLDRLARQVGIDGEEPGARLVARLWDVMGRVRELYEAKLGRHFQEEDHRAEALDLLLDPAPSAERIEATLTRFGFTRPDGAHDALSRLQSGSRFMPPSPRARQTFLRLAPDLLHDISQTAEPDLTLSRLEGIVRVLGSRQVFFQLLHENANARSIFVTLCGASGLLTDTLSRDPAILDSFVDALLVEEAGARRRRRALDLLVEFDRPHVLHDVKSLELLRIGLRDLQGKATTHRTVFDLARLAIAVCRAAWRLAVQVELGDHATASGVGRMAVLGYGNLGAMEMNYGSDVDLVFIYDDCDDEGGRFWQGVATRFMQIVSEMTDRGMLYRVDARLRPEGDHGPIATSARAFRDYFDSGRAALFEYQASLRARPVAGDRTLGADMVRFLRERAMHHPFGDDLAGPIDEMRGRLERSSPPNDLKRGRGGLVDIEFATQLLKLRHGGDHRDMVVGPTNTVRSLRRLRSRRLLDDARFDTLVNGYTLYRRVENALQIRDGLDQKRIPDDPARLGALAWHLGYSGDRFLTELEVSRARVRDAYRAVLAIDAE